MYSVVLFVFHFPGSSSFFFFTFVANIKQCPQTSYFRPQQWQQNTMKCVNTIGSINRYEQQENSSFQLQKQNCLKWDRHADLQRVLDLHWCWLITFEADISESSSRGLRGELQPGCQDLVLDCHNQTGISVPPGSWYFWYFYLGSSVLGESFFCHIGHVTQLDCDPGMSLGTPELHLIRLYR